MIDSKMFFFVSFLFLFLSCEEGQEKRPKFNWTTQDSTDLNKSWVVEEEIDIKSYLEMRKEWEWKETGSGLRYAVTKKGGGNVPVAGDVAEIEYKISLLDGTFCYGRADDEYEEVLVDQSQIESGIQEALKLIPAGSEALLIIPSHIGHGLIGDLDKIPPLTPLVVEFKLNGIVK